MLAHHHFPQTHPHLLDWLRLAAYLLLMLGGLLALILLFFLTSSPLSQPGYVG